MNRIICPQCRDIHICPGNPDATFALPAAPDPWQAGPLHAFLTTRCLTDPAAECSSSALYRAYGGWCHIQGHPAVGMKRFVRLVSQAGPYQRVKRSVMWWLGVGLRTDIPHEELSAALGIQAPHRAVSES